MSLAGRLSESRGITGDWDSWFSRYMEQFKSSSGIAVNVNTAYNCSVVFPLGRLIAEDVAKLPLGLHRPLEGGGSSKVNNSRSRIMRRQANPFMSAFDLRSTQTSHAAFLGNGYAYKEFDKNTGEVIGLWPLNPQKMDDPEIDDKGNLWYVYTWPNGRTEAIPPRFIHHVPGLGFDGLKGFSVIHMARNAIGMALAAENYGANIFANDATPRVVLKYPNRFKTPEGRKNVRESWEKNHGGPDKKTLVGILEDGADVQVLGLNNEDLQMLGLRQFQVLEMCRWFRVQPHKVAELERATYSNIEHAAIEHVQDTLDPWLQRWEQRLWMGMLWEDEQNEDWYWKHDVKGLLKGDHAARTEFYKTMLEHGVFNADTILGLEDMNPQPNGLGSIYYVPLNRVPKGTPVEVQADSRSTLKPWLEDVLGWLVGRGAEAVDLDGEKLEAWRERHKAIAVERLAAPLGAMGIPQTTVENIVESGTYIGNPPDVAARLLQEL